MPFPAFAFVPEFVDMYYKIVCQILLLLLKYEIHSPIINELLYTAVT